VPVLYSKVEKAVSKRQLFSISELAPEFGLDRRTLAAKLRDTSSDGLVCGHPAYHLGTVIQAVYGGESSVREEIDKERLRALQDERRVREGSLVELVETEKSMMAVASVVRTQVLALPPKLAPQVVRCRTPQEAEALIRKEVYAALRALASWDFKKETAA
jgi:hypothetical protein